ncbi:MAG: hypothetical protein IM638_11655 [Bacteroidetes bacterium]|nr:hypothetical protein [Bacteroidota bacterium]
MSRFFTAAFLFILLTALKADKCPSLLYDGIYTFKVDAESSAIIRFYPDRVVLVSTSVNNYADVMTWFNREPENFSRVLTGKYKLGNECKLSFKVKGETGEQIYNGQIENDSLISFQIFNPATKAKTIRSYKFVKP